MGVCVRCDGGLGMLRACWVQMEAPSACRSRSLDWRSDAKANRRGGDRRPHCGLVRPYWRDLVCPKVICSDIDAPWRGAFVEDEIGGGAVAQNAAGSWCYRVEPEAQTGVGGLQAFWIVASSTRVRVF